MMPPDDLSAFSMEELFRLEAETQCTLLSDGLVALEANPDLPDLLTPLLRAAHSLKGAARIVGVDAAVKVSHAMEDAFVALQGGTLALSAVVIGRLLGGVDLLRRLATPEAGLSPEVERFLRTPLTEALPAPAGAASREAAAAPPPARVPGVAPQLIRVDPAALDRLLGFAGESVVAAGYLDALLDRARRLRKLDGDALAAALAEHEETLETYVRRTHLRTQRLYEEALACRMRPLADILPALRRLVRDVAGDLEKSATLDVIGAETSIDRDILEPLETALGHLLRNALDHGVESPADRVAAGKSERAQLRVEAHHRGGRLVVIVGDDGRGLDLEAIRARVVDRGLTSPEQATAMGERELTDFLFLPGFTMRDEVSEISGRGVGLDVVQSTIRALRGSLRVRNQPGQGVRFELTLPISLSVLSALLVTIAGEPYAIPLAHLARALQLPADAFEAVEGRQFVTWNDRRVAVAAASQLLDLAGPATPQEEVSVVLIEQGDALFGLVVDAFVGERELVVQPLDPVLGSVPGIASASLTAAGDPLLVLDAEDLVMAMERLAVTGRLRPAPVAAPENGSVAAHRRILVVEDSLTVRELERKLLVAEGYDVEVALDGMDGWNALRGGRFDLVLTDVDMPRLDGIELTRLIKADARLRDLPVVIVSYKDREEDRRRGLDAGADYYLTKGSFQDRTLIRAVADLLGDPA